MDDIDIELINSRHPNYQQVWEVREEVLRQPLGMSLKNEDLNMDAEDLIFTAAAGGQVIGCVMLHPIDADVIKLRQMAVYPQYQGTGVGRSLVQHAEQFAIQEGFKKMVLHARIVARDFYSKLNYEIVSGEFTEVGIPHVVMAKVLTDQSSPRSL